MKYVIFNFDFRVFKCSFITVSIFFIILVTVTYLPTLVTIVEQLSITIILNIQTQKPEMIVRRILTASTFACLPLINHIKRSL